jgi:hypothetical protein
MAQLEYNLPILILGSSPSTSTIPQTISSTASNNPPTSDTNKEAGTTTKNNTNAKTPKNRTSLCEEKLIPGNIVPDIVELLVTLGLIQQQTTDDDLSSSGGVKLSLASSVEPQQQEGKHEIRNPARFAVHFGKPKQFLVTPTNILSEIAKAQTEIQLSRQRQEILKEALNMADQQAAERVKHIVLQHPQVVDDPVYVTALRNLQVDGMLMAGASGTATSGNSNASPSSTVREGSDKPKSGIAGGGKKTGAAKRRQSAQSASINTPAKRKRQRSKKEPIANVDVGSGQKQAIASSGSISVAAGSKQVVVGSLPIAERSKQVSSSRAASASAAASSSQPVAAAASASAIPLKNTT